MWSVLTEFTDSDEELVAIRTGEYTILRVGTLSEIAVTGSEADHLGDGGYWLYEQNETPFDGGIVALAKCPHVDVALRVVEILKGDAG